MAKTYAPQLSLYHHYMVKNEQFVIQNATDAICCYFLTPKYLEYKTIFSTFASTKLKATLVAMKRIITTIIILFCYIGMSAQTYQKQTCIRFRVASSSIELGYADNDSCMKEVIDFIAQVQSNPDMQLMAVTFHGSASPEGSQQLNKRLTANRRANMERYIRQHVSLPDSVVFKCADADVWQRLALYVEQSDMPRKNEVLHQINATPEYTYQRGALTDSRMKRLMDINYGRTWQYMLHHFFPALRNATITMTYAEQRASTQLATDRQQTTEAILQTKTDTIDQPEQQETLSRQQQASTKAFDADTERLTNNTGTKHRMPWALKTNMLYDALLVPNIGIEVALAKHWSVSADWMYAWWSADSKHRFWRIYGGGLTVRRWLGRASEKRVLQGHHIGISAQLFTYDFEFGGTGYMAGEPGGTLWNRLNYSYGAEYGYSMPIARRLNIDLSIAAGYMGGRYYKYTPLDGHYVWQSTTNRNWWGPTKLEVSLVWML